MSKIKKDNTRYELSNLTDKQKTIVFKIFVEEGYDSRTSTTLKEMLDEYAYPCFYTNKKEVSGNNRCRVIDSAHNTVSITFLEFIEYFTQDNTPEDIIVPLNSSYTAIVSESEVKVGCQTFPFSVIKDLHKAVISMEEQATK